MKEWKHISYDQRKVILNGLAHNYKLKDIGESIGIDPTSISKEIKRNREIFSKDVENIHYKKITRFPYTCTNCTKKYSNLCILTKYKYDAKKAQQKV